MPSKNSHEITKMLTWLKMAPQLKMLTWLKMRIGRYMTHTQLY